MLHTYLDLLIFHQAQKLSGAKTKMQTKVKHHGGLSKSIHKYLYKAKRCDLDSCFHNHTQV